jgi:hypothetical protein
MTTHHKVYWLVVVGDDQTYPDFENFCSYCLGIERAETKNRDTFEVKIIPPGRGPIEITVDSTPADQLRL